MDKQDKIILEPGIYSDISNEDYHNKIDGVSNSWLGEFKYCPAKAKLKRTSEADHFVFGRAFHTLTLEGAVAFNNEFQKFWQRHFFRCGFSYQIIYMAEFFIVQLHYKVFNLIIDFQFISDFFIPEPRISGKKFFVPPFYLYGFARNRSGIYA